MTVLSTRRRQRDIHVIRQEATRTMAPEPLTPSRSGHIVIGVDTHKHVHVAAVMDPIGGILDTLTVTTDSASCSAGLFRSARSSPSASKEPAPTAPD
jgi:hypothetical protein